ncbi:MAG: TonB-dependent receptor [Cyanobacteriota bacterium]
MDKKLFLSLVIALSFFTLPEAFAKDVKDIELSSMSLEELLNLEVTTSSKKSESLDVTPNVMYVITAEEIKKSGYQSIADVLNRIPGFFYSFKPLEPIIQVRGIAPNENNKVSIMLNGHRINNVNESTQMIWPVNLDNVEKIEIITGPGSVLYGTDSLVATVNLITKKTSETEIKSSFGQNLSLTGSAMTGYRIDDKRGLFASATYASSEGWDSEAFYRHSGEKIGTEGKDLLSRKLGIIRPSGFLFTQGEWDNWSFQFSSINQAIPEYSQNREALGVKATRYNYTDNFDLRNNTQINDWLSTSFIASYDDKRLLRAVEQNWQGNVLDTSQKTYSGEIGTQIKTSSHYFQSGVQASLNNNRHNYTIDKYDPGKPTPAGSVQSILELTDTYSLGAYVSEEFKLLDNLTLVAALRGDTNSILKRPNFYLSPRAAIVFTPFQKWTLKAMFNRATKFPNPWESPLNQTWNYERGADWASKLGPAKNPETLSTIELQSINYFGELRLGINGYYQQLNDFIAWSSSFTNVGDFQGFGAEFDAKYPMTKNIFAWMNGSWQKASFKAKEEGDHGSIQNPQGEMNGVPSILLNLGGIYQFNENISLSTSLRYFTDQVVRRYDIPKNTLTSEEWKKFIETPSNFRWEKVSNIFYLDASLNYTDFLIKSIDLRISGKNLLNNRSRVSMTYANGDMQPEGMFLEGTIRYRF